MIARSNFTWIASRALSMGAPKGPRPMLGLILSFSSHPW
jgi:hypothetical protein